MDVTRRAAKAKGKQCKLIMLMNYETKIHMQQYRGPYRGIAHYMFLWSYESYPHCGESGAHRNVIELEFSGQPSAFSTPVHNYWAASVTLNVSLKEYKEMRKNFVFVSRAAGKNEIKPVPMPEFEEIAE